ncbi:MAG: hypothetical protein KAG10_06640 [Methylococcales bacterium]|nr:hypothetical protein [Methylococcales bacterium]MCK5925551.1 hypothetical protein [Methylococcales bacterium]
MNDVLNDELQNIIKTHHSISARYQHLALSSRESSILPELARAFKKLLPDYSFWDGHNPEENNAPPDSLLRYQLINAIFKAPHKGLIIYRPAFWLQPWNDLDKQAFWSALSTRHGGHNVIIIFPESDEFKRLNLNYFTPKPLDNISMTLWISSKKQFF